MACQFFFLTGPRTGQSVRFVQPSFWIGRDPRCELAFDPATELQVSGRHAEVTFAGGAYQLRDQSTNGTFINGQQVKSAILQDGDTLQLGAGGPQVRFGVIATAEAQAPRVIAQTRRSDEQPSVQPRVRQPVVGPQPAQPQPVQPQASSRPGGQPQPVQPQGSQPPIQAQVVMARGPSAASDAATVAPGLVGHGVASPAAFTATISRVTVELERVSSGQRITFNKPVIRIGRDPSADIALDLQHDLLASYNHAKIMVLEGKAVLFDVDSTNGTFVDGQRVSRQDLKGGEQIELGQNGPKIKVLAVKCVEVAAPPPSTPAGRGPAGGGKATVFGAAADIKGLSLGDAAQLGEFPIAPTMVIGRDPSSQIVLDSMFISSRHAVIEKKNGSVHLRDLGSANGVYLAGEKVQGETELTLGGEFVIGPYVLKYTGTAIVVFDTRTKTWVDAHELCRTDPRTKRNFLDRISLKIQPGEFVTILGPSGCGKSTLLKSLNGSVRANAGLVLMNNIDFYSNYEQLKHQVGYVPQDDIIHPQLSIWRTLHYSAKLRLPPGASKAKREERIRDVLSVLELYDHRMKPIHKLSGGQRKRVSIAVELLTDPAIIYLDEPTSGLDPNLEEKMMLLLREMTLRGKTVATVTHTLDNIHHADKVTFLVDGKLAFFGTDNEARTFFDVKRLPDVYKRFEEAKGNTDALRVSFEQSPIYDQHIRSQLAPVSEETKARKAPPKAKKIGPGPFRQFWVLVSRYTEILTRDVKNTLILLLQAPLVALFVCAAVKTDQPDRGPTSTMFLIMSLSALWFGCSNAAREITKEGAIYARERMVNLRVIPYVASKFFVLQWLALLQVGTMLTIVYFLRQGYTLAEPPPDCAKWGIQACSTLILDGVPGDFWMHLANLYLTALNGIGLGLLISALAGNSDKAMSLVPLILIPQVLFSGSFGIPKADELVKRGVGYAMGLNWSLDQAKRIAMCTPAEELHPRKGGVGCTTCLHAYDPFKHLVLKTESQGDDGRCAAVLPMTSQLTDFPESLELVEDGLYTPPSTHGKGAARDATKSHLGLAVQGGYVLLLFILICIFVRLKDRKHQ
jgi:ABC-type multidrug transport system ATPase subunit/pSer/pThr/pTyr-binding forkhead associated (FHA) protein